MNNLIIQTRHLVKNFRTTEVETRALNEVNLQIEVGEFIAIMGPSGCGKSTLLNILGLLDTPTSGAYQFMGQEVSNLSEEARLRVRKGDIGFVFQRFNLIDSLTVYQNLDMPLAYLRIPSRQRKARIMETLEYLKISHRRRHYPQQLSGGQQQRVAIARAIITQPNLLLVDEPTGNLDSENGLNVMKLLTELNRQGTTIVMVTHSERDAAFAHRIVRMLDGSLLTYDYLEKAVDAFNTV